MQPRRLIPAAALAVCTLCAAGPADAAWTSAGNGSAAGRAVVMPAGQKPAGSATGTDVTIRWATAQLPDGSAVAGYRISRYDSNGTAVAVLASCAGTIATTTCTEHNVPAGSWTYTDTPVQDNWTGQASPPSNPVAVGG
jgi:hypothetical protein